MLLRKNRASSVLLSLLICSVEMVTPVQLGRHQVKVINVCKAYEAIIFFFLLVALFANVKEKSSLSIVSLVLVYLLDSNKDKHYLLQQQACCP